jgi:plastocyanin
MKLLPLMLIAASLGLGSCAPGLGGPPPVAGPVGEQPPTGKVVEVEIVIGSKVDLDKRCAGGAPATTVFAVSPKEVYHCLGNKLLDHDEHDKGNPAMAPAIVRASTGDRIRWFSKTHTFTVTVVKHPKLAPQNPAAPDAPFGKALAVKAAPEQLSPPVPDAGGGGKIQQRYKVSFDIEKFGLVDPDLICSM